LGNKHAFWLLKTGGFTMKNTHQTKNTFAGFAALVLAIVLSTWSLTGCESPTDPPSKPTATDTAISIAAIRGVTAPVTGEVPVRAITESGQYSGMVTWSGNPSVFAANTQYIATITLTAKDGFTLQGVTANYFTVAGAIVVSNNANSGVITAMFPHTGGTAENPTIIDIAAIQGVTIPTTNGFPVTSITENTQYSGIVTWSPSHATFAASTVYTATIILTAKIGYTLRGVGVNFFEVEGALSVSNVADSGVVSAVFPSTDLTSITSANIFIIAPVKSAAPGTTAASGNNVNFTIGAVSWSPANNPFLGGVVYTASVTLTAHNGYTFAGLNSASINGQNAAVSNNTGSTVTLSYTFTATNTKTVTDITIKSPPTKLTYTHEDTLDLAGLVVTLIHDDATTEDVAAANFTDKNITAIPAQGTVLFYSSWYNGQPIMITYGGLTCDTDSLTVNKITPTAADYTIYGTGTFTYDSYQKTVFITPKEGKSPGTRTIYYEGIGSTTYTKSTTAPSAAGTYAVTFDVAASGDSEAVNGLSAGTLTIEKITPIAADFTISGTYPTYYDYASGGYAATYDGDPKTVTVTPKTGKSDGSITVKYNDNEAEPENAGTYTVTFDIAATANFNAVSGFPVGTLTIKKATPTSYDFTISGTGTFTYNGNARAATITPQEGKSNGTITIYYEGTGSTTYIKSTTAPLMTGTYRVTFDIEEEANFNAVSLYGSIRINPFTNIDDLDTYLQGKPANTSDTPIYLPVNMTNFDAIGSVVVSNDKFVYLDLSEVIVANFSLKFSNNSVRNYLTGITIPNNVTEINDAFKQYTKLTSVTMNRVRLMGDSAFEGCTNLTSVTMSNNVTYIGNSAFKGCTSLTSIIFEAGLGATIGSSAFEGCTSLTSITIPNYVTTLGYDAFKDCTSLVSATIGHGVPSIGYGTFQGCTNLESVTIGNYVQTIANYVFESCTSLTSIAIPDSVTTIGSGVFSFCTSLESVTIGSGLTSMDVNTFSSCNGLTAINVNPSNTVYYSDNGVLYDRTNNMLMRYPAKKTDVSFVIPGSVAIIGNYAFAGCTSLTSVTIPNSVTYIRSGAFNSCTGLTEVTIPDSVTNIDTNAFYNCTQLLKVIFQGTISSANFNQYAPFPGNLRDAYLAGGKGTYTRSSTTSTTWYKN
jgi:hypothetical protein